MVLLTANCGGGGGTCGRQESPVNSSGCTVAEIHSGLIKMFGFVFWLDSM